MAAVVEEKKCGDIFEQIDIKSISPIEPNKVDTQVYPKKFHNEFNALPKYKQQRFGKEAIVDGEKDRRHPYENKTVDFYSRVGQLDMIFEGISKSYNGTATAFYKDEAQNRVYAITAAHCLVHYDAVNEKIYSLQNMWFDRRITNNSTLFGVRSYSVKRYPVDLHWIHSQYDPKDIINAYDLAIVSFQDEDGFFTGSNHRESDLNAIYPYFTDAIKHSFNQLWFTANDDLVTKAALTPLIPAVMGIALNSRMKEMKWSGLSIIGYPAEKEGALWGEIVTDPDRSTTAKIYHQKCKEEKQGRMISYSVHTPGGQSGSSVVNGFGKDGNRIVAIHVSTNSEDKNYGVKLNGQNIQWILSCVLSKGRNQNVHEILQLFPVRVGNLPKL